MGESSKGRSAARAGCALLALAALWACGPAAPRRVISLSESTTRVAEALALGDRLESLDPNAPDAITRAFSSGAKIALADTNGASEAVLTAFASQDIAVRVFSPTSTDEVLGAYTEIATVLGEPKAAAAMIERVTRELAKSAPAGAHPRVALVLSRSPLRVVGGDAFLSHVLELAGIENVFGSEGEVTVRMQPEQLEAKKPDRVLDVPLAMVNGAWVDPVGTAQSLARAL